MWKITQHKVLNIDGTKNINHSGHRTQFVFEYPTKKTAQTLEENSIIVFGPRCAFFSLNPSCLSCVLTLKHIIKKEVGNARLGESD